ncbi:hypothetical protein [Xanthomonas sp. fls2-241-TYG-148]|uniref:hypothetical protein n=1 Tax=Xanthomonas sp. fls2-241-TYG-148 TaxID=3040328 RepID=UPI002557BF5E|nr:hypothetical protein [Xanthomonas sp. fls2-241-TYG-148]
MSRHDPAHTHDLVGARSRAMGVTSNASIAHKCAPTQAVISQRISTVGARSRAMGITGNASIAHKCAPTQAVISQRISTVGARSRAMGITSNNASIAPSHLPTHAIRSRA